MLEKKFIKKEYWKRVEKRKQTSCNIFKNGRIIGVANLLKIEKCTAPLVKKYENIGSVKIVDNGYYWLQIALKNKNYWITAMYNEKKEIIQYYIDITYKNEINSNKEALFYDLFLDIVYFDGNLVLLDENELDNALDLKIISYEQFKLAKKVSSDILKNMHDNINKLDEFCLKYLGKLSIEMEEQ